MEITNDIQQKYESNLIVDGCIPFSESKFDKIEYRFNELGLSVHKIKYDNASHKDFQSKIDYASRFPAYIGHPMADKSFQHFFCYQQIEKIQEGSVFVDVAASDSPLADIIAKDFTFKVFRQDLSLQTDLTKNTLGGFAHQMPFAMNSIDVMTLTCSLEHFENQTDILFFQHASRLLKANGVIIIVPLYMNDKVAFHTDPEILRTQNIEFDSEGDIHLFQNWRNRFGRFYSPDSLYTRIVKPNLGLLEFEIFRFIEVSDEVNTRWALIARKQSFKKKLLNLFGLKTKVSNFFN